MTKIRHTSWIDRAPALWQQLAVCKTSIGQVYDLLTVKRLVAGKTVIQFWCQCSCGSEVIATARELETRRVRSCGHCRRQRRKTLSVAVRRVHKRVFRLF